MPYCTQCGNQVSAADKFCARCGATQRTTSSAAPPFGPGNDVLRNTSPRTASMLCYIPFVGWIAAIVVLASARFRMDQIVRFHAFQGIYLFVAWLIVDWVVAPVFRHIPSPEHIMGAMAGLVQAVIFFAWIWMIIKTSQEQLFRLPIIGELADRSVAEQR